MLRRITAIEPQKRIGSKRVNVFLDGSFAFSLQDELAARLTPGSFLSDAEIAAYQHEDDSYRVLDAALTLLSYRPRSVFELRSRLLRKGFESGHIEDALERLKRMGVVDDADFAQFWVENRQRHRPRGGRLLQAELRAKGIERDVIESVLPDEQEEDAAAYRVAQRKARSLDGLDWQTFRKKLGDHLVRRGFGYETANYTVKKLWQELHPDDDDL
ncbi:MAG: regulatory protein RecX [Chloroflexota bacterium]